MTITSGQELQGLPYAPIVPVYYWMRKYTQTCDPGRFWDAELRSATSACPFHVHPVSDYSISTLIEEPLVPKYKHITVSRLVPDFDQFTERDWYLRRMSNDNVFPKKEVFYTIKERLPDKVRMKNVKHFKFERWSIGDFQFRYTKKRLTPCTANKSRRYPLLDGLGNVIDKGVLSEKDRNPTQSRLTYVQLGSETASYFDAVTTISKGLPKVAGFTFKTEANMLVTMLEIRSMLSLFSPILRQAGPLGRLASTFLTYSFAIAPTLSDISTMLNMSRKIEDAISDWNEKAGKIRYFHWHISKDVNDNFTETLTPNPSYSITTDKELRVKSRATIALTGSPITVPKSIVMLKQMGFDKPLSAAWELIPFSFILDWFTDIGGFLEQFETSRSPARFVIHDACFSTKRELFTRLKYKALSPSSGYSVSGSTVYESTSSYARTTIDPELLNNDAIMCQLRAWDPSNRFGGNQAILLGSLAIVMNPSLSRS